MPAHNPMHDEEDGDFEIQELDRQNAGNISDMHELKRADSAGSHYDDHHGAPPGLTRVPDWMLEIIEHVFKIKKRRTTVEMEIYTGVVQFISCIYVLPVVPAQMKRCGYDETGSIIATSITCALGCIAGGILTDMPLIIAPPTSVSIFMAVSMQQGNMNGVEGNAALLIAGASLALLGFFPPLGRFFAKLIPDSIQAAISVGIGLITALAGATEVNFVIRGKYTILDMGEVTLEVVIAFVGLVIVASMLHYHVKGAFCTGLIVGTFLWWICENAWPTAIALNPKPLESEGSLDNQKVILLIFNLFFLFVLTLNGLARSLSDLAHLTKPSGAIPRGNLLFLCCGLTTMLSGYLSGPPILISPESAAGIKAGAKTGLSTVVCGVLFGVSTFFSPIFNAVPAAGTAPLLIMVGVIMFANAKRIDWTDYKLAVPAYCVLLFIPFTYSILRGVAIGYVCYIMIGLFTGHMIENIIDFAKFYREPWRLFKAQKPLPAQEEFVPVDDGYVEPHSDTTVGRYVSQIGRFMDSMEMVDTGVTSIEQM